MGGKPKSKKKKPKEDDNGGGEAQIWVDPDRVRFQHARIRPYFSSCGRALTETLDEIRAGKIQPSDLPPIQVRRNSLLVASWLASFPRRH